MDCTTSDVSRALDGLGTTPDEVAASLTRAGCKGARGICEDCPVSVYLRREFDARWVVTSKVHTALYPSGCGLTEYVDVDLPDPVVGFINRFDDSQYPELEAPRRDAV